LPWFASTLASHAPEVLGTRLLTKAGARYHANSSGFEELKGVP
jgi:hypothetical protein